MRLLTSFALLLALAGCASDPQSGMPGRDGDNRPRRPDASRAGGGELSSLPPGNWWRSDRFAGALNLTDAQKARLDELDASSAPSLADYRRIAEQAQRDLAVLLDSDHPASADILIAGSRIRDARDKAFDAEIRHVADVRDALSHEQWLALEAQMRAMRDQSRDSGGQGRGRRGGMGGRRPGSPF
jgi:Spy/CpxP family protein refolding chaperone